MVDFRRRLVKKQTGKILDPLALYGTLDRASDKGELRRAQEAILATWYARFRGNRDVILKLHTGQGKTLIGLLILLSRLNEHGGRRSIYASITSLSHRPASRLVSS